MLDSLLALDKHLFLILNRSLATPALDSFFTVVTRYIWVLPVGAALLVLIKHGKKEALTLAILAACTVGVTDELGNVLKPLIGRPRPCDPAFLVEGARFLVGCGKTLSFPSNHALNVFGQAMLATCFYPRGAPAFFLFSLIIGYSRVYLGAHYPLDILGGAVLGTICGAGVFRIYRALRPRLATEPVQGTEKTEKAEPANKKI
jgi:undecaprenyl-diphosphatase